MSRISDQPGILGVFPSFDSQGGVQLSGRIAWEGLRRYSESSEPGSFDNAYLFLYGEPRNGSHNPAADRTVFASSKIGALVGALRMSGPVKSILVWHIALLKLIPFFRCPKAKIALFLHGIEAWKTQDIFTRSLLERVTLFVSNSNHTWQQFVRSNPQFADRKHVTVPLGIASAMTENAVPSEPPAALMIGRLHPGEDYKGHREVIGVWPLVLKEIPDAQLWIVGDGELRHSLTAQASELGLGDKVRFLGWVSESEKQDLINRCRCLALPSRGEGFGLVYLEAMRQSRPCLVSTSDAGREVVNPPEAGLAVDITQPQELVDAAQRLLRATSEWNMWSEQARGRYESGFTAKHFQSRLIEALSLLR